MEDPQLQIEIHCHCLSSLHPVTVTLSHRPLVVDTALTLFLDPHILTLLTFHYFLFYNLAHLHSISTFRAVFFCLFLGLLSSSHQIEPVTNFIALHSLSRSRGLALLQPLYE